jgi:putative membrane protein insertion efficiency factor
MKKLLLWLIKGYRLYISPMFPGKCRFYPTCSAYAQEAIEQYGARKGFYMAFKRVLKCNPFHPGGYDPVK